MEELLLRVQDAGVPCGSMDAAHGLGLGGDTGKRRERVPNSVLSPVTKAILVNEAGWVLYGAANTQLQPKAVMHRWAHRIAKSTPNLPF